MSRTYLMSQNSYPDDGVKENGDEVGRKLPGFACQEIPHDIQLCRGVYPAPAGLMEVRVVSQHATSKGSCGDCRYPEETLTSEVIFLLSIPPSFHPSIVRSYLSSLVFFVLLWFGHKFQKFHHSLLSFVSQQLRRTWNAPADQPDWIPELSGDVGSVVDDGQVQAEADGKCPEEGGDAREDGQGAVGLAVSHVPVKYRRVPVEFRYLFKV